MIRFSCRSGITLIELLVTLVILAVIAGVVGVAFITTTNTSPHTAVSELGAARREAIRTRRAVTVTVTQDGASYSATAFPDGTVAADPVFATDRLTGRTHD